jgi:hypothetical protein
MRAHFFDLDVILINGSKVWVVDKTVPNIPILKISQSDFNLVKSGIFKNQGNNIKFSGHTYWLQSTMMDLLKIKCKKHKADFSNLGFSMQEFMNPEIIENSDYDIDMNNILHLKNTDDHIYIICSRNTKRNYEKIIKKIEDKLKENGLIIKNFYFISETFYNRDDDDVMHKKVRLLLQHLIGYKTDGDKFIAEEVEKYNQVYYYDDDELVIKMSIDSNKLLMFLISNSDISIKSNIKEQLKSEKHILVVNQVTGNKVNRFKTEEVILEYSNLIKMFDSFNYKG